MESNWRWNAELICPGGCIGDVSPISFDPQIYLVGKLIPPLPVINGHTITYIATTRQAPGIYRYWLGNLTPVGVLPPQFQWWASNFVISPTARFPFPAFPVEPD